MREIVSPLDGFASPFGRMRGAPAAFTPASLFANGEAGTWIVPSPATAFNSTTDVTPCAIDADCGFALDQSQGASFDGSEFLGLGSELVTNGDGSSTAGWATSGSVIFTSNGSEFFIDRNSEGPLSSQPKQSILTVGKTYLVTLDVLSLTNTVFVVANPAFVPQTTASTGPASFILVAEQTDFYVGAGGALNANATIDNISVREIPGYPTIQATAAARPAFRQTVGGVYYLENVLDDSILWDAPAGTYTIGHVNTSGTVTLLTSQSLSGATDIMLDPELVGYVAVDRALTADETSGLTAYLGGLAA
jgi:hypothetical protein